MKFLFKWYCIFILIIFVTSVSGCTNQAPTNAGAAVETYFKALVAKDSNALVNASCASWESNALQELRTFDAVEVTLQDLKCGEIGQEGTSAIVTCSGKIVANYGNEVLDINLSDHTFKVILDSNEWRMCGYQ